MLSSVSPNRVSTHSRLKAAGHPHARHPPMTYSFNTQPPEGGWGGRFVGRVGGICFNTQPPEGGWGKMTHEITENQSFNTQPPEGGWLVVNCQTV